METNIAVNNVDIEDEDNMDESAVEQLVQKLIETKDSKTEELMSECSDRAKQIRNKINEMLETRESIVATNTDNKTNGTDGLDSGSQIDTNSLLKLQKELELEISGLNKTSKVNTSDENSSNGLVSTNTKNKTEDKPNNSNDNSIAGNVGQPECPNKTTTDTRNNVPSNDSKPNEKSVSNENKLISKSENSSNVSQTTETNSNKTNNSLNSSRNKQTKNASKSRLTAEQLNKKLSTFSTDAERISYLSNCLVEVSEDNRNLSQQSKQNDKMTHQLNKEKDQMQTEQNRLVLAKSRLESLCRELQRQNRIIKEESLLKIKEEEEKRREIANKFQSTLNEIMQLIAENQKRNTQLKEENADLAQKLKTLMGHYESWEKHTEKIIKQKDLETQLMKAKFSKTDMILNQEKQIFIKEKQQLIQMIADLQKRCSDMAQSEIKLRTELSVYTNKYEEFQSVLTKSNDMFGGFKKDMERMSKQIKKLEKETQLWKDRWESSNKALLKLSDEKQKRDSEHLKALQKIITLEKLCRAMQEERALLHERLELSQAEEVAVEEKTEVIPQVEVEAEPEPEPVPEPEPQPTEPIVNQNNE